MFTNIMSCFFKQYLTVSPLWNIIQLIALFLAHWLLALYITTLSPLSLIKELVIKKKYSIYSLITHTYSLFPDPKSKLMIL